MGKALIAPVVENNVDQNTSSHADSQKWDVTVPYDEITVEAVNADTAITLALGQIQSKCCIAKHKKKEDPMKITPPCR